MKKLLLSALLATALFSTPAMAKVEPDIIRTTYGDFDAFGKLITGNEIALKAMKFKQVEKQAKKGDNTAQFYLAKMYQLGIHTQKDKTKALEWYKKSAENGNANAMNNLAAYLNAGIYYDMENNSEALAWFKKAVEQNHPIAMMNLAHHYLHKKDNSDIQKGIELLLTAGELGFAPAYYELSNVYRIHTDIEQDEEKALIYLKKSAELGYAPAQKELTFHLMTNATSTDPKERAKETAPAYPWASRACANGVQISCELKQGFIDFTTTLLNENQLKCEQGNKEACKDYEIGKALKEEIKKYQ